MDILDIYNAEILWSYVTGEKAIPRSGDDKVDSFYHSAVDFGTLCALTSLQKATSNPSHRPIDYEFVDIYNGITKALLATLEMGQKPSMTNLGIIAEYIGPTFTDEYIYKRGLDVVLRGDISDVYVGFTIGESIVEVESRRKIIGMFAGALSAFIKHYGISETRKITSVNSQSEEKYKRV